jgi:hypothetical protein
MPVGHRPAGSDLPHISITENVSALFRIGQNVFIAMKSITNGKKLKN